VGRSCRPGRGKDLGDLHFISLQKEAGNLTRENPLLASSKRKARGCLLPDFLGRGSFFPKKVFCSK